MQASVAGARNGEDPEYVAYLPAHWTIFGSPANASRALACKVRNASIVARSRGDRIRRSRPSGPLIGPAKNVRSLTSQILRPCSRNSRKPATSHPRSPTVNAVPSGQT
jgi:hypothetical protein